MSDILASELEGLDQWRNQNLNHLKKVDNWLRKYDLTNDAVQGLIADMRSRLSTLQLRIAFVAEFSRGKSELINAIFFANSGRRIMPASVGRTTMCPVEVSYDASLPPCIRLLPLETRRENVSLTEWRYGRPQAWVQEELDIDSVDQLAKSISKVSERQLVTLKEAVELGFWDEDKPEENPSTNALGLVEIPKWRHAVVNYPHPLLKRGISILDTPGLNTVGVEPELTLELLPQAHAVFFVLAADTGVTRSDLQIWRDYLAGSYAAKRPCYVLLNKIDVLWDGLLTEEEAASQLQQQRENCAALLDVPLSNILNVSAQKGLLGKIKNDTRLLLDSHLLSIERLFVRDLLPKRKQILHQILASGINELHTVVKERLLNQQKTLDEQLNMLQSLHGKNTDIFKQVSARIVSQKEVLESLRKKASALRMVEKKLLRTIQRRMSHESIDKDLARLTVAIKDSGIRSGIANIFEACMDALRMRARKAETAAAEFEALLISDMQELEREYGITLTIQPCPGLGNLIADIDMLQNRHEVFFNMNQTLKLRRNSYAEQMFKTLLTRTRSMFDEAFDMLDMWSNSSYSVLVVQVQDLENAIKHHYDGIQRILSAKEPLDQRIDEIETTHNRLFQLQSRFDMYMHVFEQLAQDYSELLNADKTSSEKGSIKRQLADKHKAVMQALDSIPSELPDAEEPQAQILSASGEERHAHVTQSEQQVNAVDENAIQAEPQQEMRPDSGVDINSQGVSDIELLVEIDQHEVENSEQATLEPREEEFASREDTVDVIEAQGNSHAHDHQALLVEHRDIDDLLEMYSDENSATDDLAEDLSFEEVSQDVPDLTDAEQFGLGNDEEVTKKT